jgi:DNA-directed DNA polymerase III PolC
MFALRVKSYYSLLRATASPRTLCERASRLGYPGLALTDRDNLYGLWEFLRWAKRLQLSPIIGAEISDPESENLITCLVKDKTGYRNLCGLISARHMQQKFRLLAAVEHFAEGLILLCCDLQTLKVCSSRKYDVAADLGPAPSAHGRLLRNFARDQGIPVVATPNCSMATAGQRRLYLLLQAVRLGTSLSQALRDNGGTSPHHLEAMQHYQDNFAIWPEVIATTKELAQRCRFNGPEFGIVMPPWGGRHSPESPESSESPELPEPKDPAKVLREKAYQGARSRYGDDLGEIVVERLEHELKTIEDMGFSCYFLVVRDIVHRKGADGRRRKRRICGRGSGAASLVAYCLDITNVCPIKYNLYFERFLHPERLDPPDIDIDFSWDERDAVLDEVLHDFSGRAAMVCNHVFFKPRMAIRETARAFGLGGYEISLLTRRIPWLQRPGEEGLKERLESLPALRDLELNPPWPEILELAAELIGLPRYLSVHPGGVVITPGPITDYVPVERAAKGVPIIQWEKDGTEEAGLVKIDLLGNRSLGVIRDCLAALGAEGVEIIEQQWHPEDDTQTKLAVAEGATMGCFYIESPAMRLLEKKAATGDFEQLVIQSSIIRPAANEFVREYVRRLQGGTWQPLCPQIGDVLDETFGLMVYQEDVSRVAVALAGFSHGEADGLRKIMSKKDKEQRLKNYREKFYTGCAGNGVDPAEIDRMWAMMMSFDGYSFCKPHSASYARVSFQAAYLKRHYPAQFMAAVIANQGGYYSTFAYVSEAKRMGLTVDPPDVNESGLNWSGRGRRLRVGLQAIHGLSGIFLQRLVGEREKRPFSSSGDFFSRTRPADNQARALIQAGGLDSLQKERNRTVLLWQWASFQRMQHDSRRLSLFVAPLPEPPPLAAEDLQSALRREYRVLGFLCSHHPLELLAQSCASRIRHCRGKLVTVSGLANRIGQRVQLLLWLLTGKIVSTRTGEAMEFLTFEDQTGQLETTFFPQVYRDHAHLLCSGRGYLVSGLVEEDYGALTLTVSGLSPVLPG